MGKIIKRLAATVLETREELELVIKIIFGMVMDNPHYCETYVDMVRALSTTYPEFPPEEDDTHPYTFRRMLLNTCQEKFEELPTDLNPPESARASMTQDEVQEFLKRQKVACLAIMKFIGHLFLCGLLA